MNRRTLEMNVGEVDLESGSQSSYKVLRITRIADYSNVPKGAESRKQFVVEHYLKIQMCLKSNRFDKDATHVPLEKEIIFPLERKVVGHISDTDIERVEVYSRDVNALIHSLEEALETNPENAMEWGKLVSIPDWVWINKEDKFWWHERPPESAGGKWVKYEDYIKETGHKWLF